jgi:hypothetical protein
MDDLIPASLGHAITAYIAEQDSARGDWSSQRPAAPSRLGASDRRPMPSPPYPATDNPALKFLIEQARIALDNGDDPLSVALHATVHGWLEGHIEGYDRGQRDAHTRRPA